MISIQLNHEGSQNKRNCKAKEKSDNRTLKAEKRQDSNKENVKPLVV